MSCTLTGRLALKCLEARQVPSSALDAPVHVTSHQPRGSPPSQRPLLVLNDSWLGAPDPERSPSRSVWIQTQMHFSFAMFWKWLWRHLKETQRLPDSFCYGEDVFLKSVWIPTDEVIFLVCILVTRKRTTQQTAWWLHWVLFLSFLFPRRQNTQMAIKSTFTAC